MAKKHYIKRRLSTGHTVKQEISQEFSNAITQFQKKAAAIVGRIARDRDKLRDLLDDYEAVLEDIDEAKECWDTGLETISQLL
jgi:flagellar hook-associated protein FlgK